MNHQETVFITGATRGIGACLAEELVKKGYQVIGTGRNVQNLDKSLDGVHYVDLDLSKPESISTLKNRIDLSDVSILINNAGQSQIGSLEETPIEKYEELFQINVFGILQLTQELLPFLKQKPKARVINVGSLTGKFPLPYYSSYCATKFAVDGMTQALRHEMKTVGIDMVVVHPNDIKTSITPTFFGKEGSDFYQAANKIRERVKMKMANATPVEYFVEKMVKIVEAKKTKPAYYIGGNANFLVFVRRFMTDTFALKQIEKSYK
ncbi:MAG: SDR family oxidoreductase [Flavobacteriales bacterium]|jgi:short-subunit dehydrogenase|nr:SDR family oxidoreductase [Flavobacteriales bacterium]